MRSSGAGGGIHLYEKPLLLPKHFILVFQNSNNEKKIVTKDKKKTDKNVHSSILEGSDLV